MTDTITVKISDYALDPKPGAAQCLVEAIEHHFHSGKNVCLDFSGLDTLTPSFRTNALRVTAALHTPQFLKAALTMINVGPHIATDLQDIFGKTA